MKNKLILLLTIILFSCGGSRKPKTHEAIVIVKINKAPAPTTNSDIYCKYIGEYSDKLFTRNFKIIDTCGKFKIGDTIYVNFYKK